MSQYPISPERLSSIEKKMQDWKAQHDPEDWKGESFSKDGYDYIAETDASLELERRTCRLWDTHIRLIGHNPDRVMNNLFERWRGQRNKVEYIVLDVNVSPHLFTSAQGYFLHKDNKRLNAEQNMSVDTLLSGFGTHHFALFSTPMLWVASEQVKGEKAKSCEFYDVQADAGDIYDAYLEKFEEMKSLSWEVINSI